jgi:hypothetical protein
MNRPTAASVGSSGRRGSAPSAWRGPRYRPPGLRGVAFHVLSSAEAALGAGFDLERIGLRAVAAAPLLCETYQFCKKPLDVENQGVTVCETYL